MSAMLVNLNPKKHKLSDSVACQHFSAHTLLIYSFINVRSVQWQTNILEDIKSVIIFIYLTVTAYEFKQRVKSWKQFNASQGTYSQRVKNIKKNPKKKQTQNDRIGFIFGANVY